MPPLREKNNVTVFQIILHLKDIVENLWKDNEYWKNQSIKPSINCKKHKRTFISDCEEVSKSPLAVHHIIGGENSSEGEFPHMVIVLAISQQNFKLKCFVH